MPTTAGSTRSWWTSRSLAADEIVWLGEVVADHVRYTGSPIARALLDAWATESARFCRVMPRDYRRVLELQARSRAKPDVDADRTDHGRQPVADPSGFLKYSRQTPTRRPVPLRLRDWNEVYEPFGEEETKHAGGPLHGLRYPVLSPGLPAGQPDPGVERAGPHRALGRRLGAAARHQQLPGVHRSAVPGAVRGRLRPGHRRRPVSIKVVEQQIADRAIADGGLAHVRRRCPPAGRWRSSVPGPPVWPPRSSSAGPATR